jgi:transcription elongation GreA/GreB family factor
MDKRKVVQEIQAYLAAELGSLLPAAEAGKLSAEKGERVRELQSQLTMYKFLPLREYSRDDVICPASLVELELLSSSGRRAFYFIVPSGGGLIMKIEESPVQVITPLSPLGEALLGKKVGDKVRVETQGAPRDYQILSMS